jgi:UDP-glucose 4-epimerase
MSRIFVTGGTGYIGSHTVLELVRKGHEVAVMDNLSNSSAESLSRIQALTGVKVPFYELDLLDKQGMLKLFAEYNPDSVIHFAGLKAVGESVEIPLWYYKNNITGTLNLLEVMQEQGVKNLVFSSSCTVYGEPEIVPITESAPLSAVNPYGQTKLTIEYILKDLYQSDREWNIAILRYFNPVGADESGTMGEDPNGIPNNLMPYVTQVAVGHHPYLRVFGSDYPTHDGTGVRDYIHVTDLALGHIKAIEALDKDPGLLICNLGTGNGYSVLDVVMAFEKASGIEIPYQLQPRRAGDAAAAYADPTLAKVLLGWQAERDLEQMCRDAWNWQQQNPDGY